MASERSIEQEEQEEIKLSDVKFLEMPAKFGSIPIPKMPLGAQNTPDPYEKEYPHIRLPIQEVETFSFGNEDLPFNKVFWGDNLHIMRQLPKESIDLIYIDPPFFSGRNYNVIFGDNNEIRSFTDIWEGGMPGYLIWLNARLVQMKRLLKPTGSIFIHLDWHASHYVKVEMDKIFGYENFRREIIWVMTGLAGFKGLVDNYVRAHDVILYYSKTNKRTFNKEYLPYNEKQLSRFSTVDEKGRRYKSITKARRLYLDEAKGIPIADVWSDITGFHTIVNSKEKIGYPTQKPEALLERIIKISSKPSDVVADFFVGGGTTAVVAQKLGRRWIACDQSRVAVAITIDRLLNRDSDLPGTLQQTLGDTPSFKLYHWGNYFVPQLSKLSDPDFKKFIIECFNGEYIPTGKVIHGIHKGDRLPIFVGSKSLNILVGKSEVISFAKAVLENTHKHEGFVLGWGFDNEAKSIAHELRKREGIRLDFVKLEMIKIGTENYRQWVVDKNKDYDNFLQFIQPPVVKIRIKPINDAEYEFDASESQSMNSGEKIVNVQWDFNYNDKRFKSTRGYSYNRENDVAIMKVNYKFPVKPIGKKVACRVQDSAGGEGFEVATIK